MAKSSGIGDNLYISGYDLSGDVGAASAIRAGLTLLDTTGINKAAFERLQGIEDGEITFAAFFNDATSQEHAALKNLGGSGADRYAMYLHGTTIGNPAAFLTAKQVNYDGTRGNDGSLGFTIQCLSSAGYGLEWGRNLTAGVRTDTAATNGTAYDNGAASSAGLTAQLQVFSFSGTSVTVKLQESSDNAGDAYTDVTGGGFTAATGRTAQRIATASGLAVERYLRVVTTGTFSSAVFAVAVRRG